VGMEIVVLGCNGHFTDSNLAKRLTRDDISTQYKNILGSPLKLNLKIGILYKINLTKKN